MTMNAQSQSDNVMKVACSTGLIITAAVPIAMILIGAGVYAVNHYQQIWSAIVQGLTFGGQFWPAAATGIGALAITSWTLLLSYRLDVQAKEHRLPLVFIGTLAMTIWLLSFLALPSTYASFGSLTFFQSAAVVMMYAPFVLVGIFLLIAIYIVV